MFEDILKSNEDEEIEMPEVDKSATIIDTSKIKKLLNHVKTDYSWVIDMLANESDEKIKGFLDKILSDRKDAGVALDEVRNRIQELIDTL